jgi:phosphohistidine phosphatase
VQLFLIRHAAAVDATADVPDAGRCLSDAGRRQAAALGERLRWYDCIPSAMWTSPLLRAVETAELIAAGLRWTGGVVRQAALSPTGDLQALRRLFEAASLPTIVIVGHEPSLSRLAGLLCDRPDFAGLRPAEAVRVDDTRVGIGRFRWRFGHDDDAPRTAGA